MSTIQVSSHSSHLSTFLVLCHLGNGKKYLNPQNRRFWPESGGQNGKFLYNYVLSSEFEESQTTYVTGISLLAVSRLYLPGKKVRDQTNLTLDSCLVRTLWKQLT